MKNIIRLGDYGWSYITENEEAAEAIEKVVSYSEHFTTSDYEELSPEAKEAFDKFTSEHELWVVPDLDELIWDEALKRKARNGGWEYDVEDLELEGYKKWDLSKNI